MNDSCSFLFPSLDPTGQLPRWHRDETTETPRTSNNVDCPKKQKCSNGEKEFERISMFRLPSSTDRCYAKGYGKCGHTRGSALSENQKQEKSKKEQNYLGIILCAGSRLVSSFLLYRQNPPGMCTRCFSEEASSPKIALRLFFSLSANPGLSLRLGLSYGLSYRGTLER